VQGLLAHDRRQRKLQGSQMSFFFFFFFFSEQPMLQPQPVLQPRPP
jgi:hypothetical protein